MYKMILMTTIVIFVALSTTSCGEQKVLINEECLQLPGAKLPDTCKK
jgi:hypothetical protein